MKIKEIFESDEFTQKELGLRPYITIKKTPDGWQYVGKEEAEFSTRMRKALIDAWKQGNRSVSHRGGGSEKNYHELLDNIYSEMSAAMGSDMIPRKRFDTIYNSDRSTTMFDIIEAIEQVIIGKKFGRGKRQQTRATDSVLARLGIELKDITETNEHISEIIEPQVRSYDMSNREMHQSTTPSGFDAGHFSTVKRDRDPHFIQKTSRDSKQSQDDGYWFFIRNVIDHKLWENPYFPRVYQFKKFAKDDQAHYRVQLEKLIPYSSLSVEEAVAVFERVIGMDSSGFFDDPHVSDVVIKIVRLVRNIWDNEIALETIDDNLVSAVKALQKMNPNGKLYEYDLHMNNIMYRRGPHGVHPVIIDPFSFKR